MYKFFTIVLINILCGVELDIFIPSFPQLRQAFSLSPFLVQLTLSVNFVAFCVCSLFAGTLGDRFDRRNLLLISLTLFILGSLCCVFAKEFPLLLLGRFLQGVGIAAPSVLSYVIISDDYPIEKQPGMLGILNGIVTITMAFAPVLGSYINLLFNWRGNFIILLTLGIVALFATLILIPSKPGNKQVSLSPTAYVPLLKSKNLLYFIFGICFLIIPYWIFIGMAPILYMEDIGVELKVFGYYQGVVALAFGIVSIFSTRILSIFKQRTCFYFGLMLCSVAAIGIAWVGIMGINNPLLITGTMLIFATGVVFPVNILYPLSLEVVPLAKARTAALVVALRLILASVVLEGVSYIYKGTFLPIALSICMSLVLSMLFILYLLRKDVVQLSPSV